MRKYIVPTDFSDTSKNAALFAVRMAADVPGCELILFHSFDKIVSGSDGTPITGDTGTRMGISLAALENVKSNLPGNSQINIRCVAKEGSFLESLENLVKAEKADMVVMGINGATRLEQVLIGSSTLGAIGQGICPVMIIPPAATYKKIRTVVYACDMKNVDATTPVKNLRNMLSTFNPKLYVVNVDTEHYVEVTEEYQREKAKMNELLSGFEPDYAFIRLFDFTDAINQFATDRNADLIITVPRKHSFLTSLFSTSHTKKLAYHSHLPVLAIHE
jgi:nucleotide-binding universal stress UspA family protein